MVKPRASEWLQNFCQSNTVVLGSSSQWRKQVLDEAGCKIASCVAPDIDEKAIRAPSAQEMSMLITRAKAEAVLMKLPGKSGYAICSDQVAVCNGEVREKPESEEEARRFLKSYSEDQLPVSTVTSVVVINLSTGKRAEGSHTALVHFSQIPPEAQDTIVHGKIIYTCCGGFSVEDPAMGKYVRHIDGGVDSVMGMPLGLLESLCQQASV